MPADRTVHYILLLMLGLLPVGAAAQLPASQKLSTAEEPLFRAETDRLDQQLAAAPDNCWVMNELARTWAAGHQYPETLQWLDRIAALDVGLDPSRDPLYTPLHGTREFEAILRKTKAATGPVSSGREAFRIAEGDLTPESSAWDPHRRRFYFGSMRKGSIVSCDHLGHCAPFASGLGTVLGLKTHGRHLWAVSITGEESALVDFNLQTGKQARKYVVPGKGHRLNDIAVASGGDVYVTDTEGGALWKLNKGDAQLHPSCRTCPFASPTELSSRPIAPYSSSQAIPTESP